MPPTTDREPGPFWAITCFFNPTGSRRRSANYLTFRQKLSVPLVTVELSYQNQFSLHPSAADILIQLRGGDVLWQKERLLNIALQAVPDQCRKFAWLDCDVVFEREDWPSRACELLDQYPLIQPFRDVYELPPGAHPEEAGNVRGVPSGRSLAYAASMGMVNADILRGNMRLRDGINGGLAWASRREVFAGQGFYDACILGSGNRAMACAALGRPDDAAHYLCMSRRWVKHYLAWAGPHFEDVRGRVGYAEGGLFHLWHGDLRNRQYAERHLALSEFLFDPYADIAVDSSGCWRWASQKQDMHQYVKAYFSSRKEDGEE